MPPTKPEAKPGAKKGAGAKTGPTKYPAGTEVRYQRHSLALPEEMTAKEVLDWLPEDDFPELAHEETELRHDKEKNRLVPVRKAQKKGDVPPASPSCGSPRRRRGRRTPPS